MLATLPGTLERVCHHSAHTERGVEADLGGYFMGRSDADRATGTGVGTFGPLAHHHEIDVGVSGERTAHARIQPRRPQVDVVVQLEAQPQQQTSLQHATGHRRITDRAKQDGVMLPQFGKHRVRQQFAGGVVTPGAQVVVGLLHAGQHRVKDFDRLGHHLRADPVAARSTARVSRQINHFELVGVDGGRDRRAAHRRARLGPAAAGSSRPGLRRPRTAARRGCSPRPRPAGCRSCPALPAGRRSG